METELTSAYNAAHGGDVRIIPFLAIVSLAACNGDGETDITIPSDDQATDGDGTNVTDGAATGMSGDTGTKVKKPTGVCAPLRSQKATVTLAPTGNLVAAIATANDGDVILLEPGTYQIPGSVTLGRPITIRSTTNNAADVIIDGNYGEGNLFEVEANDVTIAHVTLTQSKIHTVYLEPEPGQTITGFRMHGVRVLNSGGYGVVATAGREVGDDEWEWDAVDNSEISCSRFELEDAAKTRLNAICRAGAIDMAGVRNWVFRDNHIENFFCDGTVAPHAVRFWRGSRDNIITRNNLIDIPYGIVVGEGQQAIGRVYADSNCVEGAGIPQTIDTLVTNNIVAANQAPAMRVGILAQSSCRTRIIHNSIFTARRVEGTTSSIEHWYPTTTGLLANNLMSDQSRRFVKSDLRAQSNFEQAPDTVWNFIGGEDYRLAPAAKGAIDMGSDQFINLVPNDIDDELRDAMPDIGADERL